MNWQPIETAPKDGTEILIFRPIGTQHDPWMFVATWQQCDGCGSVVDGGIFMSNACVDSYVGTTHATHWMPLPEPPQENLK